MHTIHKLGHSNVDSLYYKLWQEIVPHADFVAGKSIMTELISCLVLLISHSRQMVTFTTSV